MNSIEEPAQQFSFHLTSDMYAPVEVCIDNVTVHAASLCEKDGEGMLSDLIKKNVSGLDGECMSLYVSAVIHDTYGRVGVPVRTSLGEIKIPASETEACTCIFNHMLTFPIKYKDLDLSSQLSLTVWCWTLGGEKEKVLGSTTFGFFSKKERLKTGRQSVDLHPGKEADESIESCTSRKLLQCSNGRLRGLESAMKQFERGEMEKVDWLDSLVLAAAEEEIERLKRENCKGTGLRLCFRLPKFEDSVLYSDLDSSAVKKILKTNAVSMYDAIHTDITHCEYVGKSSGLEGQFEAGDDRIILFTDPEIDRDSPAEVMAQKLARSAGRGQESLNLRPNTSEKAEIDTILKFPPSKVLSASEKELLWRFRYALTTEARALTKLLQCVDWSDADEALQTIELMRTWAQIDIADALELLSPAFPMKSVRSHAVVSLSQTSDDNVILFLLQLVQALRYEEQDKSELSHFLLQRALASPTIASSLFWYLCSELDDPVFGSRAQTLQTSLLSAISSGSSGEILVRVPKSCIPLQLNLLARLRHLFDSIRGYRTAEAKTDGIRKLLGHEGSCEDLKSFQCPCPLDPVVTLNGVVPQDCLVFKSKVNPVKMTWLTEDVSQYTDIGENNQHKVSFIYKKGDDLRQDQLVLQLFLLMDRLLKREHLDLQITPYRVLPTSVDDGLIEFVPNSVPISGILREYGSIQRYLSHHAPSAKSPYGIKQKTLSNYIRSCAGYTVFTHVLGIGDRHNDNVMITTQGRLFHIDFGYFLGRDPKFTNAPLVLGRSLVDGMGGADSPGYSQFMQLCCEALNILRKSANLLLSIIHVMAGSSIPDIRSDPEVAMLKIQEKLRLDLSDEDAAAHFEGILTAAQAAMLPRIAEVQHRVAQGWR